MLTHRRAVWLHHGGAAAPGRRPDRRRRRVSGHGAVPVPAAAGGGGNFVNLNLRVLELQTYLCEDFTITKKVKSLLALSYLKH